MAGSQQPRGRRSSIALWAARQCSATCQGRFIGNPDLLRMGFLMRYSCLRVQGYARSDDCRIPRENHPPGCQLSFLVTRGVCLLRAKLMWVHDRADFIQFLHEQQRSNKYHQYGWNSPGGNLMAGIKLGKVIRDYELFTYISKDEQINMNTRLHLQVNVTSLALLRYSRRHL